MSDSNQHHPPHTKVSIPVDAALKLHTAMDMNEQHTPENADDTVSVSLDHHTAEKVKSALKNGLTNANAIVMGAEED